MSVFDRIVVFIPAFKKSARFRDDLVRKLVDVPLVQRVIDKARSFGVPERNIHLLTDTEEIALFAIRNNIGLFLESELNWVSACTSTEFCRYISKAERASDSSLLLSPYAPLLTVETVGGAAAKFHGSCHNVLAAVRAEKRRLFSNNCYTLGGSVFEGKDEVSRIESQCFVLLKPGVLSGGIDREISVLSWDVKDDAKEIESLQDWWVCGRLLQRKRIIFRIIGNNQVGMGHIYRALTLARELLDHEVLFVTDTNNRAAVKAILKHDYWLGVHTPAKVTDQIMALKPDMVIHDVLNTERKEIERLQGAGAIVISFEDLGSGAQCTDLTVNEIYDTAQFTGDNVLWGHKFFFLRDEFHMARPHRFKKRIDRIMLAFGGTDQHDLSRTIFHTIKSYCKEQRIFIDIVTGPGYQGYERLSAEVSREDRVSLTHATGVISRIMERAQLAITSNGRTVFEFAHMNIPSIVIAQHDREITHSFAKIENGFIPLGLYRKGKTEQEVSSAFSRLVCDEKYRQELFRRMTPYRFGRNKQRVVNKILKILERRDD